LDDEDPTATVQARRDDDRTIYKLLKRRFNDLVM
jgi:hypothetical protein